MEEEGERGEGGGNRLYFLFASFPVFPFVDDERRLGDRVSDWLTFFALAR